MFRERGGVWEGGFYMSIVPAPPQLGKPNLTQGSYKVLKSCGLYFIFLSPFPTKAANLFTFRCEKLYINAKNFLFFKHPVRRHKLWRRTGCLKMK